MVSRWTGQLAIRPSEDDENSEASNLVERDTKYFYSIEEFGDYFSDNFLICSWLPENVSLNKIIVNNINEFSEIFWEYDNSCIIDWKMQIWMYQGVDGETAGATGTLKQKIKKEDYINDIKITFYEKSDGTLVGFEYDDWWYLIELQSLDEEDLTMILKGLKLYETTKK